MTLPPLMYTVWNWALIAAALATRAPALRVVAQANSVLVLLGVFYVHVFYGLGALRDAVEQTLGVRVPARAVLTVDALAHWAPVLLLGVPAAAAPLPLLALPPLALGVWYALVRRRLNDVYAPALTPARTDRVVAAAVLTYLALVAVLKGRALVGRMTFFKVPNSV